MTARLACSIVGLIATCSFALPARAADDVPEKCRPFIDTVDRCQRYETQLGRKGWKTEFRLTIGKGSKVKEATIQTPQLPEEMQGQFLRYAAADDANTIQFDASQFQQGLLKIGPEVSGEFAVEMRAKAVSARLNDLSIMCDAVGQGPAFQFGGYENTRNILCVGQDENGRPVNVEGDASVLIRPGTWHRVRLEVRKDEFVGLVDGRVIARGKPAANYDFSKKRQPLVYVYASTAVIADYRIDRPTVVEVDLEKAWKDAFVHKTRDQVVSDLTELSKLLNDPEYETRQAAHNQLARAGSLAEAPLRVAASTGGLEGRERARSLLQLIGVDIETD